MSHWLELITLRTGISAEMMVVAGVALSAFILFYTAVSALRARDPAADRMAGIYEARLRARQNKGLLLTPEDTPRGVMKTLLPSDRDERSQLRRKLNRAGFGSANALRNFILIRIFSGLVLPGTFLALVVLSRVPDLPLPVGLVLLERIGQLSIVQTYLALSLLVGAGYLLPMKMLNARVTERKLRIEQAFPNALDLLQISVEAGLGFDAAMTRVGNELASVSPELSTEFLITQHQIQAGRAREDALKDMALRTDIDAVNSFSSVVQQSIQFGTSISDALTTYSEELRVMRETKAQEMANKLPVKMSAVLASLMLPALILLSVGPTVIRYIEY